MPHSDEHKDKHNVEDMIFPIASHRDVDVTNEPQIVGGVPRSPKFRGAVIINQETKHIFWNFDAVEKTPSTKESPNDDEFQPEIEENYQGKRHKFSSGELSPQSSIALQCEDCISVDKVCQRLHKAKATHPNQKIAQFAFE
eukprot:CAMPEP_0113847194 /NCGR_PEP_ID=MMETSP0372-20130328/1735_1 /TAXON_ID=340204 /ORGANISM="Lankesteria abbotti" /LENGTH=140 /DNA_ID=CAMNT_0000816437 /DNA_START=375 /DNA_END=797 /DNA_ORIENTATION=- /assembly_acc=CAM_ASM_000359